MLSEACNHVRIERLHLDYNPIGDDGLEHLLLPSNSANLVELSQIEIEIRTCGFGAMSSFLQRENVTLRQLDATCVEGAYLYI